MVGRISTILPTRLHELPLGTTVKIAISWLLLWILWLQFVERIVRVVVIFVSLISLDMLRSPAVVNIWIASMCGSRKALKRIMKLNIYGPRNFLKTYFNFRFNILSSFIPSVFKIIQILGSVVFEPSHVILIKFIQHISCKWCR